MNTNYNLNLQTSAVPVVVNANQYDKGIRQYTFTVYNGDELADLTDVTAVTFDATKPDGYGLTYSGTISDDTIVITTTEQLTAVAGDVRGTIRLWNADSDVIGSQRVTVKVERNGVDDDTIISDSDIPAIANAETYATTCQTLVNSIASESAQIQEIADNQCIIEDDTANNDVIITQYEQGSGSDVALVNTVNNNTTRISALENGVAVDSAAYGICTTAAATAEKVVTIQGDYADAWTLQVGSIIGVRFTYNNTASNVTLNVNDTGSISIYYGGSVYTGTSSQITSYANRTLYYMYDGTYWAYLSDGSVNTDNTLAQVVTTDDADYEVIFSYTADNTSRTERARKNDNLLFNPSTGNLQTTQLNGVTIGSSPEFTDTTYTAGDGITISDNVISTAVTDITSEFTLGEYFADYADFFKVTIDADKIVRFKFYGNWGGGQSLTITLASADEKYFNMNYKTYNYGAVSGTLSSVSGPNARSFATVSVNDSTLQVITDTVNYPVGSACAISLEWYAPNA